MPIPENLHSAAWQQYPQCAIDGVAVTAGVAPAAHGRAFYVGVGGTVVYTSLVGTQLTLKNVPSGSLMSIGARSIDEGTTATDIVLLY
jgi:hypothetical protein